MTLGLYPLGGEGLGGAGLAQITDPATPTFQAIGSSVKAFKKAAAVTWPTHQAFDIAFLFVEGSASDTFTLSTPAGFVEIPGSPFKASTTQLAVFWCRASSVAMPSPTIAKPGDHIFAVIATYRGCAQSGDPWEAIASGIKAGASTTVSAPSVTTLSDDDLVIVAVSSDRDAQAPFASSETNAALDGLVERFDAGTTLGNGGGLAVMDGVKASPGACGITAITVVSSINAYATIALKGPGNVSVALTGAQLTTTPGAIASITGNALVALTGAQLHAQPGTVAIAAAASVSVAGASLTITPGIADAVTGVNVVLAGAELQAQAGTVEPVIDVNVRVTGARLTVAGAPLGMVAAGTVGLEGAQLAITGDTVAARGDANVEVQGAELAVQAGSVAIAGSRDVTVALVGRELSASGGAVIASASISVAVSGAELSVAPGEVAAAGDSGVVSVNVHVVGASLLISRGTPQVSTPAENDAQPIVHVLARQPIALEIIDGLRQAASR